MGPYKRNWFVGGTVLLGLVTLAVLIILFGGSLGKVFAGEKIYVRFRSDRGDGISEGSSIRYLGKGVGNVKSVALVLSETPNYVMIQAELDRAFQLSSDVTATIRIPNFLGSGAIIELDVPPGHKPTTFLKGGETIATKWVGLGVLPPEFGDLATEMRGTLRDFREANVIGTFKTALSNFNDQVTKAGAVMDNVNAVLGTQQTQTDLKTAIAQAREAVERANKVAANFEQISEELKAMPPRINETVTEAQAGVADARATIKLAQERLATVSDQLARNLDKVGVVLDDAKQISGKVNTGGGTLALLLNDSKLYDTIVTATETINQTVKDVQRVIRGFEEDGVPLKLK